MTELLEKPSLAERRAALRAVTPGAGPLKGWAHFAAILALGAGAAALAARMVVRPLWWEWAAIPAGFLIANFVEWFMHRGPMHHPTRGLRLMYQYHTLGHHRYFPHDAMEAASPEEFNMVLFSPASLAAFLLGFGGPIAALFFAVVSRNAGWIFTALAVDYYVLYEFFHLAYHLPAGHPIARLPGMAALRRHHVHHHDEALMSRWNFNVTFPIFDVLFGTCWNRNALARGENAR